MFLAIWGWLLLGHSGTASIIQPLPGDHIPAVKDATKWKDDRLWKFSSTQHNDAVKHWGHALDSRLIDTCNALEVMQNEYYELWMGTWPAAIDWTAAVVNTMVTSTLTTFSGYLHDSRSTQQAAVEFDAELEDHIETYFAHIAAFYFGENAFNIRHEAYDDMLWVVIGWLESTKFINKYSQVRKERHHAGLLWHGRQYIEAFSHRARIFYDLAAHGWDTKLCRGGMTWNPSLAPYKNAVTNQLFISASVGMYLYFSGDDNRSPFVEDNVESKGLRHDHKYLQAAIDGYSWLKDSNMTNHLGLYVDGYHIRDWSRENTTGTGQCDERNEMVYTYNQAVVLSGLRGLWEATGHVSYLEEGHRLVRNAINATGWKGSAQATRDADDQRWKGLGRSGILEDYCDHTRHCSQDAQTFKGIFFEHLVQFCEPLPRIPLTPGKTFTADKDLVFLHRQGCIDYGLWAEHNAQAASNTRDSRGRFAGWWGQQSHMTDIGTERPLGSIDYRNNQSILSADSWTLSRPLFVQGQEIRRPVDEDILSTCDFAKDRSRHRQANLDHHANLRERGRTVEMQASGLSVLRASWQLRAHT